MLMIAADWYGPFPSIEAAGKEADANSVSEALYLAVNSEGQAYAGISGNICARLKPSHHVLGSLKDGEAEIWVGLITSQPVPGKSANPTSHSTPVKTAEKSLALFLELSENQQLRSSLPARSSVLFNRWYDGYDHLRRVDRGHKDWPDIIEYDAYEKLARLVWFGEKQIIYEASGIQKLFRE